MTLDEAAGPALSGAGLVRRAAVILRTLATVGNQGAPLTSLAYAVGLPNATLHRLLRQLIEERLAMQIEGSRRYALGPLAYEIGLAAARQFDMRSLFSPVLTELAAQTGETVYLILRSGDEAVCIDIVEGPSPVRIARLRVGSRRPLGLGAGGLAILAALTADEADRVLRTVAATIEREWGLSEAFLRKSLQDAQRDGYALIRNRISAGVTAVGRSFSDGLGRVFGAVSVAAVNERMGPAAVAGFHAPLARACAALETTLRRRSWPLVDS
ncbi:IclR family transcriptional regulator [Variovorax terrae]|uniref:IclR family transcriptional regulator n=1 Tax=Variovorax terrae TaxID=2923278 RepID=A0A9X1VXS4_9BURK|nr:IclR family transcriptional regulator [Variovorax terrae]MCJ0764895.1 IclR family transcriptional regulator [Variovorax terrae]